MAESQTRASNGGWLMPSESLLSLGILAVIVLMLVPLPPLLLDLLLALNVGLTVLLLMVTLATRRAMELSVFPSLLLLLTLFRLSLNVATTRLILLSGQAGEIVAAFGNYVVGGNVVVGLVIFLILVIIQFVVITKGAGRISEVAARFTLDSLPGKQMAIDAELNAGAIDEHQARERRRQLAEETEFYGAMDGASKFVRGDAIAGLIITAINLVGGVIIGLTMGMSLAGSFETFSILTIGDGLLSQIPALVISTTAGLLTTKASSERNLGRDIGSQLFAEDRPLWTGFGLLSLMALLPGIPAFPFLFIAGAGAFALWRRKRSKTPAAEKKGTKDAETSDQTPALRELDEQQQLRDFLLTDRAIVEVGPALATLINSKRTKSLPERITTLRREFSQDNGLWIPPIRVRANLDMPPDQYRILIAGREVASGHLKTERHLAILPENMPVNIPGEATTEPVFKLAARWIDPAITRQAEAQGCTVVDPASVLVTHLGEMLQQHGHELLTRETLKQMLDAVKDFAPTVIDEIKSETVRMGMIHQVLLQLAEDKVSLSDLALVLESLINNAPGKKTPDDVTDAIREDLGHLVCARYQDAQGGLRVLALQPQLESRLRESLNDGQLALAPNNLERLLAAMGDRWRSARTDNTPVALLSHHTLRRPLRRLLRRAIPGLGFIAYREVPSEMLVNPVGMVRLEEAFDAAPNAAANPQLDSRPLAAAA
jgi:flagellar biosynthesis protein FlhA